MSDLSWFRNRFPYTKLNDINLDWLLKRMKELSALVVSYADDIQRALTQSSTAITQSETAVNSANNAVSIANSASATADAVSGIAEDARTIASAANNTAIRAENVANGIAETAQSALETAQGAETIAENAEQAAESAQITAQNAVTIANGANTRAGNAEQSALTAISTATAAQQTATEAAQDAETAQQAATAAAQDAETAQQAATEARQTATTITINKADIIKNTISGNVASFPDGADGLPIVSLAAQIEPVQASGRPTPESPLPISGWTECNLAVNGKNFCPMLTAETKNGQTVTQNADGSITLNGTFTRTSNNVIGSVSFILPAGSYILSGNVSGGNDYSLIVVVDGINRYDYGNGVTFTITEIKEVSAKIYIKYSESLPAADNIVFKPMIRFAADANNTFVPYSGERRSIIWQSEAGNVFGAELYINDSGNVKLLVNKGLLYADGSVSVVSVAQASSGTYYVRVANNIDGIRSTISEPHLISDRFTAVPGVVIGQTYVASDGKNLVAVLTDQTITTVPAANAWFRDNPTQFVYDLAEPIEYDLSDVNVLHTLMGQNNIWADCGDVTVEYRADTKLYIEKIIAPSDNDMISDAQITSGKYFIIGGNLYKSTTVIAKGDTIIPGSNCIATNLADALNSLL